MNCLSPSICFVSEVMLMRPALSPLKSVSLVEDASQSDAEATFFTVGDLGAFVTVSVNKAD